LLRGKISDGHDTPDRQLEDTSFRVVYTSIAHAELIYIPILIGLV